MIQAAANCLNLSFCIAESKPTFSAVTVVEPLNAADGLNFHIGHLDEIWYVSTVNRKVQLWNSQTKMQMKKIQLITVRNVKLPKTTT